MEATTGNGSDTFALHRCYKFKLREDSGGRSAGPPAALQQEQGSCASPRLQGLICRTHLRTSRDYTQTPAALASQSLTCSPREHFTVLRQRERVVRPARDLPARASFGHKQIKGLGSCLERLLHYFVSQALHAAHTSALNSCAACRGCGGGGGVGIVGGGSGLAQGTPARHLLVSLVTLSKLAEITTTPRVKGAPVSDSSRVEATASDEADAFSAQAFNRISNSCSGEQHVHTFHYFRRILPVLVAVPETAISDRVLQICCAEEKTRTLHCPTCRAGHYQ